jgi:hypothetical protein
MGSIAAFDVRFSKPCEKEVQDIVLSEYLC